MKFDVAAKIVNPGQRAWVVHAGKGQANFREFVDNNIVYLEAPYLRLDPSIVADRKKLRKAIRQSIKLWDAAETTGATPPSDNLNDYSDAVFEDKAYQTLGGSIHRLFGLANVGDLVVVPGKAVSGGTAKPTILLGEIAAPFSPDDRYSGRRPHTKNVLVRKVNWLRAVDRKKVSIFLETKIGRPPAVRKIKIEKDTEELLKHAYPSYIFSGSSSGLITADAYDGTDFPVLNRASELIAFLVSAHAAIASGQTDLGTIIDVASFIEQFFKESSVENIELSFSSPGGWRIVGATATLAAFVVLGVAVFASGNAADMSQHGVQVINSVSPNDPTTSALQESMNILLRSVDNLEVQRLTKIAVDAKSQIGLNTPTKIVP